MRITKYAQSEYCVLTHNRFKCYYTLVEQGDKKDIYKEAHNVSIPGLQHTKFSSTKLTERSARILGEILIKIADMLKENKK